MYGIYLEDYSGVGTTVSENIHSAGINSQNLFEGVIGIGSGVTPHAGAGAITPNSVADWHFAYQDPTNGIAETNTACPSITCQTYSGDLSTVSRVMGLRFPCQCQAYWHHNCDVLWLRPAKLYYL